jgi:alkanesulfonate monooxygenase SsuD/methylene tetrahydromethanopterin reductase-like flavin-dependent oxidoreductase (luciferase family)
MRAFVFHLMPWPHLPPDYNDSAWVWCPNRLYDPAEGHRLYTEYLDQFEYAERLGFDGVCVNEHHQNAYGTMPSPNLMAAALARRTTRVKLAVIGDALPLYNPPIRVAEEFAMLDVLSNGRLIAGFVVGGGPEYYSYNINPTQARERFLEAHDLIVRAWTEPGPFQFHGKYTRLRYVNPWPRPIQTPHPPIWIPGAGSYETMDWVAAKRYAYMGIPYFHFDVFRENMEYFREACRTQGYEADPEQIGYPVAVYLAESDGEARRELEPHLRYFIDKLLRGLVIGPPGYTSARSAVKIFGALDRFMANVRRWEDLVGGQYLFAGRPETVREQLLEAVGTLGCGNLLCLFQLGSMPGSLARRNMALFAGEILPALRREFGGASAAVAEASAEPTR